MRLKSLPLAAIALAIFVSGPAVSSGATETRTDIAPACVSGCTPEPLVSEPAALTLFGAGLALLGNRLRRTKV